MTDFTRIDPRNITNDLYEQLHAGTLSLDYLRWSIEDDQPQEVRGREYDSHATLTWIIINTKTLQESLIADVPAFLRELFVTGPYGPVWMDALMRGKTPGITVMPEDDIVRLVIAHADSKTTRLKLDWVRHLLESHVDSEVVEFLLTTVFTQSINHLFMLYDVEASRYWKEPQVEWFDRICKRLLSKAVRACKMDKKYKRTSLLLGARLRQRYPEAKETRALEFWIAAGFTPKNAARAYAEIVQKVGVIPNGDEVLRSKVRNCGWTFAHVRRKTVLSFPCISGREEALFDTPRSHWQTDPAGEETWEVLVPTRLLDAAESVSESSVVTVTRPRYS